MATLPPTYTPFCPPHRRAPHGFTLIEVLVSLAVFSLLMLLVVSTTESISSGIRLSTNKASAFESARTGFDSLGRKLNSAVLNTYWDYFNAARQPRSAANASSFTPDRYGRQSDLHFLIRDQTATSLPGGWDTVGHGLFFQAHRDGEDTNPQSVIGAEGFFVAFGDAPHFPPLTALKNQKRFRLYRWSAPSEDLKVDSNTGRIDASPTAAPWISPSANVHPVADNIIALVARVPNSSATVADNYFWNSQQAWNSGNQPSQMHQIPPLVELTMVAIDEPSAARLIGETNSASAAYAALGLPNPTTLFQNAASFSSDLQTLETALAAKKVNYQTLKMTVPLPGSRWSPN